MSRAGAATTFVRELGLFDATMIVVGSMIGSGIFIVSADIARQVGSPFALLMVWIVTGALTIVAALASGELAAMFPHAGGQYVYLREAFGPLSGFLYGWTLLVVIQAGTIAAVAVAFAKFMGVLVPWVSAGNRIAPFLTSQRLVAILLIALLTWVNTRGIKTAKWVQNIFTTTKIAALALIAVVPLLGRFNPEAIAANFAGGRFFESAAGPSGLGFLAVFGAAMVGSLFSSDAWNNVAFAGEEIKEPHRTLPRSLVLGVLIVTLLYCLANVAYLGLLPLAGTPGGASLAARGIQHAAEDRVGTAAMEVLLGEGGALLMAVFVMISTFGCNNALILAGPRLYYAMARDRLFFRQAGTLNRHAVPAWGLVVQGILASLLTLSGTYGNLLDWVIFAAVLFYLMTVAAVFVLRRRRPDLPRPYRMWGYPVLPALYILFAGALLVDLLVKKPTYTWPGLLIVILGIPFYFIGRRGRAA